MTAGVGEAYTPTAIGADGAAYAINDANLFAVGQASNLTISSSHTGDFTEGQNAAAYTLTVTNSGSGVVHQWSNTGDFFVTFTAYNTDNPGGVSTNVLVQVLAPTPPQLQSALMTSNAFQFQFAGQAGATYYIQFATNLEAPASWQTLQSIYNSTGGVYQISDSAVVSNATRFYRVLAQ